MKLMSKKCHFDTLNFKNFPTVVGGGGGTPPPLPHTLPRSVASLPRFGPLLKNPGHATARLLTVNDDNSISWCLRTSSDSELQLIYPFKSWYLQGFDE